MGSQVIWLGQCTFVLSYNTLISQNSTELPYTQAGKCQGVSLLLFPEYLFTVISLLHRESQAPAPTAPVLITLWFTALNKASTLHQSGKEAAGLDL